MTEHQFLFAYARCWKFHKEIIAYSFACARTTRLKQQLVWRLERRRPTEIPIWHRPLLFVVEDSCSSSNRIEVVDICRIVRETLLTDFPAVANNCDRSKSRKLDSKRPKLKTILRQRYWNPIWVYVLTVDFFKIYRWRWLLNRLSHMCFGWNSVLGKEHTVFLGLNDW